ncbi:WASP homolog-associated protein with actin, membranes and microtubules isoform X1 [Oncorhynchus kisutch]|uniref:WASP homolog-associated protein with actin, membranes and microtubules isoform X1 n=1 Tax=Oncorhynchus kisutch TaxID=8019 RepID=UPI0012DBF775|nr:WASP homolog-associated protein with actin, membranes and microtubules isoform X1 [Oncorhynchus kisutch]
MNSIDCERLDSLDGWVAIKTNIFEENETFKLGFIVQWNVIESKFAVTCHNRTLQRQKRKDQLAVCETETSWAGLFSVNDLKNVHRQFTGVGDVVAPYFPDLSDFKEGNIWDMIFLGSNRTFNQDDQERDLDTPCRQLEKYFSTAIDICGRKIVLDSLFPQDERDVEEYFENMQEFKRKTMQDEVTRAKDHLRKILQSHGGADRMILLLQIYHEEDLAYQDLVTVATTFYQYLLQPFRDMRELAGLYKMEILKSLDEEELGPKRIAALEREAEEWRRRGEDAVSSIQDITVSYFIETSKALGGMLRVMGEDKRGFGQASWASAAPRLEKLRFLLAKETLQHMRATEMCLHRKKHTIREKMGGLSGQDQRGPETVDNLELQYYEAQLELYDAKFEILKNEELLLVAQIDTLRRQIKELKEEVVCVSELKEEVVYYDVCEDPEELQSLSQTAAPLDPTHSPVNNLGRCLQQLEAKRGNICARRAYLRNKKDQCVEANEQKHRLAQHSSTHFTQHHGVALKREKRREDEERRKEWMDQERERTLSRLRSFREKRQGSYVLKTPRSKMAAREPQCSDLSQPLSIISIGPSPSSNGAAPRKTPRKLKPKDIPVQIFTPPLPPPSPLPTTPPTTAVPPPQTSSPPPPPPPPLPALTPCKTEVGDSPMPLSEKEAAPFPAKMTLKQNLGSMDEVLASLQRGQVRLRRVQPLAPPGPGLAPSGGDLRDNIMSAIRLGVKLRKVVPAVPLPQDSRDTDLQKSIKAAMQRMKKVSSDSDEDEERGEDNTPLAEWDS